MKTLVIQTSVLFPALHIVDGLLNVGHGEMATRMLFDQFSEISWIASNMNKVLEHTVSFFVIVHIPFIYAFYV